MGRFLGRDAWVERIVKAHQPADDLGIRLYHATSRQLLKAIDDVTRVIPLVVSTEEEDRSHDIVTQAGWMLDDYRKSGVGLFGHDWYSFPVSKCLDIAVLGSRLVSMMQYATREESPEADTTYKLVKGGYLLGVSPGFKMERWEYVEERGGLNIYEARLYEISNVPVQDNQSALAMVKSLGAARAAGIDLRPLKVHAEKGLDTWPDDASDDLHTWLQQLYRLGGNAMKGKTIKLGQTLTDALAKAVTPERSRDELVAAMAEKAALDVAEMEAVLSGEADASPSLAAAAAVAGVIGAPEDAVVMAMAGDAAPETPAAPPPPATSSAGEPPATPTPSESTPDPSKGADPSTPPPPPHDPACSDTSCKDAAHDDATGVKAFVRLMTKTVEVMADNTAATRELVAEMKARPAPAATDAETTTKAAGADDDLDLDALDESVVAGIVERKLAEKFTSLTGRLAQ